MKWLKRHKDLSTLLLITLGLSIWYTVTSNSLSITIAGGLWGLVILSQLFKRLPKSWGGDGIHGKKD